MDSLKSLMQHLDAGNNDDDHANRPGIVLLARVQPKTREPQQPNYERTHTRSSVGKPREVTHPPRLRVLGARVAVTLFKTMPSKAASKQESRQTVALVTAPLSTDLVAAAAPAAYAYE